MSLETIVNDLVTATDALHASITDKRTVLDSAAALAAVSLTTTQGLQAQAATSAATAAAKATEATNNANQVAAYKTAAAALDVTTTATAAVTNLLPDMLAKKDPARHPFRKKMPTLVLDFERQKCHRYSPSTGFGETPLLPFMTFARNSAATYTGPDGLLKTAAANEARFDYDPLTGECKGLLVEEQRTNLFTDSHSLHLASAWGNITNSTLRPAAILAPDGTLTSSLFKRTAVSASFTIRSFNIVPNSAVTFTLFVHRYNCDFVSLRIQGAPTYAAHADAVFNLATGTVQSESSEGGYTGYKSSIQSLGNGWFRIQLKAIGATDNWVMTAVSFSDQATAIDGFSTSTSCGGYLWGAQLEAGAFPTSYIPTPAVFTGRASTATYLDANGVVQTAASGVARSNAYDYDSDGVLRPIGLLLEASATNLGRYSEQFESVAWNKYYSTVTANATTAPDGNVTADYVIPGTVGKSSHGVSLQATPISASTIYTKSVYLKAGGYTFGYISIADNTNASGAYFDLSTGVVGSTEGNAIIGATIKKAANGFYRCTVTYTSGASATMTSGFVAACAANGSAIFAGDGISGIYIWGAQLEQGSYATSYIPTTSAQVTRAADTSTSAQATRVADDAKVDGTKFSDFYNQTGGTLRIKMVSTGTDSSHGFGVWAYGADSTSLVGISNNSATDASALTSGFVLQARNRTALTVNQNAAVSYKKDAFTAAFNGVCGVQDTSCLVPSAAVLRIGANGISGQWSCGTISRISYYPQPFTNEELQVATSA